MAPYHHMLAHFPVALLGLAFLIIAMRSFSDGKEARRFDAILPYLLVLGVAIGAVTLITGFLIWTTEASLTSPMGRNKILISAWMLATWTVIMILRLRGGESAWEGPQRYVMLGLGSLGGILLATTGTLGGHLLGSPSRLSGVLREIGWDVYHTYYAPGSILLAMVAVGVAGLLVGLLGARKPAQ